MERAIVTVICYKTKQGDSFLSYMTWKSLEEAQKEADKLNKEKPAVLWNKEKIDWNKIDYFFADRQEDF